MKSGRWTVVAGVALAVGLASTTLGARTETRVPSASEGMSVVAPTLPAMDPRVDVVRVIEEGRFLEALTLAEHAVNRDPRSVGAWQIYVRSCLALAADYAGSGRHSDAQDVYGTSLAAMNSWRAVVVSEGSGQKEDIAALFDCQRRLQEGLDAHARSVLQSAEALHTEGKGGHWYVNDDEEKFIDALVLLDALRPDILSNAVRQAHADQWEACHAELSTSEEDSYKVRTAIVNGRNPLDVN